MMVASQAIKAITSEIIKLRESEFFLQLLELVNCFFSARQRQCSVSGKWRFEKLFFERRSLEAQRRSFSRVFRLFLKKRQFLSFDMNHSSYSFGRRRRRRFWRFQLQAEKGASFVLAAMVVEMGFSSRGLGWRRRPVSRCKARRQYMKQLVEERREFGAAHSLSTSAPSGSQAPPSSSTPFASSAFSSPSTLPLPSSPTPPSSIPPPPPPTAPPSSRLPISPGSDKWTSLDTNSPILPPPPPSSLLELELWGPFPVPPSSRYSNGSSNSLAMVVAPRGKKDLSELVEELDEYFLKATEAGNDVSFILDGPKTYLGLSSKFGKYGQHIGREIGGVRVGIHVSHTSTLEKLFAWEKKLYLEVKPFDPRQERQSVLTVGSYSCS
ncbi:hypothetical protein ZIOFF_052431 [Zingiber officinale]|uniref:Uncharacterized protein n=1 Tax=Zingiber officinale TaxID=94328 RepID=A0A8J5FNP3_ZINOF|nr:hypothetical protein ZIOFF_052431 [Zingiber officinale]